MTAPLIASQVNLYRQQFLEHGDSPEGTFNQSESIQHLRFFHLLSSLSLENSSLHDVGCGICDLYHYISHIIQLCIIQVLRLFLRWLTWHETSILADSFNTRYSHRSYSRELRLCCPIWGIQSSRRSRPFFLEIIYKIVYKQNV